MMICKQCEVPLPDDIEVCPVCGFVYVDKTPTYHRVDPAIIDAQIKAEQDQAFIFVGNISKTIKQLIPFFRVMLVIAFVAQLTGILINQQTIDESSRDTSITFNQNESSSVIVLSNNPQVSQQVGSFQLNTTIQLSVQPYQEVLLPSDVIDFARKRKSIFFQ